LWWHPSLTVVLPQASLVVEVAVDPITAARGSHNTMNNKKQKIFSEKQKRIKGWPVMHHSSKKQRNKVKCHYPASVPSH